MQLKTKQATGTFFTVLWSSGYIVAKSKGLIWLAFGAEKGRTWLRFALLSTLPLKHCLYVILPFFFPIHLSFYLFQLEYHPAYEMATAFEVHFAALLSSIEQKKQFSKKQ